MAISAYVLPLELRAIPNALARRFGGVYVTRIYALRQRRHDAMCAPMVTPPFLHTPNRHCTLVDCQGVARAWLLAGAQLVWDFKLQASCVCCGGRAERFWRVVCRHVSACRTCHPGIEEHAGVVPGMQRVTGQANERSHRPVVSIRCEWQVAIVRLASGDAYSILCAAHDLIKYSYVSKKNLGNQIGFLVVAEYIGGIEESFQNRCSPNHSVVLSTR